ncbi:hypothetical protein HELRODRAFT_181717 [Helobdella robusta]|uniref:Apple domain-containing protein n=1 Tax=Helobdella robusta TaxID=6412 RepID=T1FH91_HELRO|nr:hypothetical protein HELRODRAFT_181717 [Helobdella robusta]ESN92100.1 hypothetical protein HELRODRAFT_181717 [Helobdella robusta]
MVCSKHSISANVLLFYVSDFMVDRDANPDAFLGHCYHGNDSPGAERLDHFIIGLTSADHFQLGSPITRVAYPLCGQYRKQISLKSKHTVRCTANLLFYRFVIIQQPADGVGALNVCELEVYEANDSKCLCQSVNFNQDESFCQLNQHVFGYNQTHLNFNLSWSFYEVHYT